MIDAQHVVLPVYTPDPRRPDGMAWQLEKIDVTTGAKETWPGQQGVFHFEMVTALAAAGDGTRLASADAAGHLSLWGLQGRLATKRLERACIALAFSRDGRTLVSGTAKNPAGQPALLKTWNLADPAQWQARRADIVCANDVSACDVSPDGKYLAYTSGNDVMVSPVADPGGTRLNAAVRAPLRVAFPRERPFYRIALGTRVQNGRVPLEQTFDTSKVQLGTVARVDESKWILSNWCQSGWDVQTLRECADGSRNVSTDAQGRAPSAHSARSEPARRTECLVLDTHT